ncbi:hypothetical protein [Celeribacter halophilus]|uniref:hypothetical protein n=1 Tax=Celeribacter halophilus TaxID=576117 RepID=UPI003A8FE2B0
MTKTISPSFSRALRLFVRYSLIVAAFLSLCFILVIIALAYLPNTSAVWSLNGLSFDREFIRNFSEPIGAPIALLFGAPIAISGALAAIYLASIASDLQRQQYDLEIRAALDKEFSETKQIMSRIKAAQTRLLDFTYKRDMIIQDRITETNTTGHGLSTVDDLVLAVEKAGLHLELLTVITDLSEAFSGSEQSVLASELREATFNSQRARFLDVCDGQIDALIKHLRDEFSGPNEKRAAWAMSYGGLQPDQPIRSELEQRRDRAASADFHFILSDAKASATPTSVVQAFLAGYGVFPGSDGSIVFGQTDYTNRDPVQGCASCLGLSKTRALKVGEMHPDMGSTDGIKASPHIIDTCTGSIEFLRILLSIPCRVEQKALTSKVCKEFVVSILPEGTEITARLERYLEREITQVAAISREIYDTDAYLARFKIPNLVRPDQFSAAGVPAASVTISSLLSQ